MAELTIYGIPTRTSSPGAWTPLVKELYAFKMADQWVNMAEYTGRGKYSHLQQIIYTLWPKPNFVWNPWSETMLEAFCENKWTTVTGPGASAKTTSAAVYSLVDWMCDPLNTGVIVCSTTLPGLRRRIWKEITHFYHTLPTKLDTANMVSSKTALQAKLGDEVHGVFGVAVEEGNINKALGRIIGFHPRRCLIVVDEMTDVSRAIVDACVNLESGTTKFQFIGLGNASDPFDPHGVMSEPKEGWNSINVESEEWETKRGTCIHLDGLKSPNVLLGRDKFPFLLTESQIESTRRFHGEDSPQFWRMRRGFWPPEGIDDRIISPAMIQKFNARDKVIWQTEPTPVAGLDPAYGGDRCILKLGAYGKDKTGKMMIEIGRTHVIQVKADPNDPIQYQIARKVKDIGATVGLGPENLAVDSSAGAQTSNVLQREWSPRIIAVDFGTAATDKPVSTENPRPGYEHYYNRVSELWYQIRQFIEAGQIRGLDDDTAREICSRAYGMAGNLIRVESKADMKKRTGESPDLGDALALLLEVVRQKGILSGPSGAGYVSSDKSWEQGAKKLDFDGYEDNYMYPEDEYAV